MRFLVLQHIDVEHPGIFRDFMAADGVAWDTVRLDAGDPVPMLMRYDVLLAMGGPMDTWEEDKHPWLKREKKAIREAVTERGMPFLGVCLGAQLLAEALGGKVGPMAAPEVGVCEVELNAAGRKDPLFAGLAPRSKCLQWHGAEVKRLPAGGEWLASSPACPVQAFCAGPRAYALQYHVEPTHETVAEWAAVPAYAAALDRALGPGALARLGQDVRDHLPEFNRDARLLYDNFMRIARS